LAIGETLVWAGLFYVFAALLLSWERDLGWPKTDLTIAFTLAVLTAAAASPFTGRIVDMGHGRWLLGLGAFFGAIGLVVLSFIEKPTTFIAVWMLIGLSFSACLYEPCFAFVTRATGPQARRVITRITLAAGLASPIAFPSGAFLAEILGWRWAVLVFAGVVGLIAAPLLFYGATLLENTSPVATKPAHRLDDRRALKAALRKPAFWLMALSFPILAMEHGLLIAHIIPLLVERGFSIATAVLTASIFGPMQVLGRIVLMASENRFRPTAVILLPFIGAMLAALCLLFAGLNTQLVFLFAALQGASLGLISILKPVVIVDKLGNAAYGTISGWLAMPYLIGGALGPFAGALLWQAGGYTMALWAALIMASLGFFLTLILVRCD
jgi:MFS family permease